MAVCVCNRSDISFSIFSNHDSLQFFFFYGDPDNCLVSVDVSGICGDANLYFTKIMKSGCAIVFIFLNKYAIHCLIDPIPPPLFIHLYIYLGPFSYTVAQGRQMYKNYFKQLYNIFF